MQLVVIGDDDTRTGFRLAGVTRTYSGEEAGTYLEEVLQDATIGIILMNEKYADAHRDILNRIRKEKKKLTPIIVEIPDRAGPLVRETDPLKELIRKALGAQIGEEE